jgi:ankyrin repeat protein
MQLCVPLISACQEGRKFVVEALLRSKSDINVKQGWDTPLSAAAARGHLEIVQVLLDAGARTDQSSFFKRTPLMKAALGSHRDTVALLLSQDPHSAIDLHGRTLLHHLSEDNSYNNHDLTSLVSLLLDAGADSLIDVLDNKRCSAVFIAAQNSGTSPCMSLLLLGTRANVALCNNRGETPLMAAVDCSRPCLRVVKGLLESGHNSIGTGTVAVAGVSEREQVLAPELLISEGSKEEQDVEELMASTNTETCLINAQDCNGETALMKAAWRGHADIVKTLLSLRADASLRSSDGHTALIAACMGSGDAETVTVLIEAMTNDGNGSTGDSTGTSRRIGIVPDVDADASSDTDTDTDAGIDTRDVSGLTASLWAASRGHNAALSLLIDAQAHVDVVSYDNTSVIMYACEHCDDTVIEKLLSAKAGSEDSSNDIDVNMCNDAGDTALVIACRNQKKIETVELLLAFGANPRWISNHRTILMDVVEGSSESTDSSDTGAGIGTGTEVRRSTEVEILELLLANIRQHMTS